MAIVCKKCKESVKIDSKMKYCPYCGEILSNIHNLAGIAFNPKFSYAIVEPAADIYLGLINYQGEILVVACNENGEKYEDGSLIAFDLKTKKVTACYGVNNNLGFEFNGTRLNIH